jgi:hypothetical protein
MRHDLHVPTGSVNLRDVLQAELGEPLPRPDLRTVRDAWSLTDAGPAEVQMMRGEYLASDWACYRVGPWVVLTTAGAEDDELYVSLAAVRRKHWERGVEAFTAGGAWQRAWAGIPPVVDHPLWGVDVEVRHPGGPWSRSSERWADVRAREDVERAVLAWTREFIEDLDDETRWRGGEHVASDDVDNHDLREGPDDSELQLLVVPSVSGGVSYDDAEQRLDDEMVEVRPRGTFAQVVRDAPVEWDMEESAAGDALLLSVSSSDLTTEDIGQLEVLLRRAAGDFVTFELRTMDVFGVDDLRQWWDEATGIG